MSHSAPGYRRTEESCGQLILCGHHTHTDRHDTTSISRTLIDSTSKTEYYQ